MSLQVETANGKSRLSFSLPAITAIASVAGVVLWAVGFVTGYMAYTRNMADLLRQSEAVVTRLSAVETKVTETQADVRYIGQSIAELKLAVGAKR